MHKNQGTDLSCKLREFLASENLCPEDGDALLALVDAYIGQADEATMDTDLIDAGLAKLRELDPDPPKFDKEAGLANLLDAMDQREAKRAGRMRRAGRIVGIVAACVAVLMVVANAFGINPIQYAHEFAETVSFWLSPSGEMILSPEECQDGFASLQDALDADGIDIALPIWIPEGFQIAAVDVYEMQHSMSYVALFSVDEKEMRIQVITGDTDIIQTNEKENGGYMYEHAGETYYIIPNTDNVKAFWIKNDRALIISGQITEKEMERLVDSIR